MLSRDQWLSICVKSCPDGIAKLTGICPKKTGSSRKTPNALWPCPCFGKLCCEIFFRVWYQKSATIFWIRVVLQINPFWRIWCPFLSPYIVWRERQAFLGKDGPTKTDEFLEKFQSKNLNCRNLHENENGNDTKWSFQGVFFNQLPCWTVVLHASHGK